jgi:hypothetical protein
MSNSLLLVANPYGIIHNDTNVLTNPNRIPSIPHFILGHSYLCIHLFNFYFPYPFPSYVIKNKLITLSITPTIFVRGIVSLKINNPINVTIKSLLKSQTKFIIVRDSKDKAFKKINGFIVYNNTGIIIHNGFQPIETPFTIGNAIASIRPNSIPKRSVV